jgi:hypothetical protein
MLQLQGSTEFISHASNTLFGSFSWFFIAINATTATEKTGIKKNEMGICKNEVGTGKNENPDQFVDNLIQTLK